MLTIRHSLITLTLLISCAEYAQFTPHAPNQAIPLQQHELLKQTIENTKSNIAFNAASTLIGLTLFVLGTQTIQNPNRLDLLGQSVGTALAGGGIYFGLRDIYNLLNLKKKLRACDASVKSS